MAIIGSAVRAYLGPLSNLIPAGTSARVGNAISGIANQVLPQTYSPSKPVTQALFGSSQSYPNPQPTMAASSPQVLGASSPAYSTWNGTGNQLPLSTPRPMTTSSPAGGGGGGSVGVPTQQMSTPQYDVQSPDLGMFDNLIGPALQSLEAGIPAAQSAYDAAVANTNTQVDKQVGTAKANTQATQNQLNQRQVGAENTAANAVNEARRGFSEMAQGIQSRYGGSTGTGAFAESILGGQTQRNIAGYRNQLSQSIQQIEDTRNQVKMVADQTLQDLESQRQSHIANAKAQLDDAVAQIRARQGELQSRKAELVASAINSYQQAVYQANSLSQQFQQRLFEQQQAAEQKLQQAAAAQTQKVQQLQLVTDKLQGNPVGVFNRNTGSYQPYTGEQTSTQGGLIMPGVKDQTNPNDQQIGLILTPEEQRKYNIRL